MTREFLKSLGIEDKEVVDKIMTEYGNNINSERAKYGDCDTLREQLAAAGSKIEELSALDYEGIRKEAEWYKNELEKAQSEHKKQLSDLRFSYALDAALTAAKARNNKAVKALLDTEKLSLCSNGTIGGLDEQLCRIKAESGYLFEEEKPSVIPSFLGGAGTAPASDDGIAAARAVMGLP